MIRRVLRTDAFRLCRRASTEAIEQKEFLPHSLRTGLIAIKAGMTQDWDVNGAFVPLTVLWIDNCQVMDVIREVDGTYKLQLGCGSEKEKNVPTSTKKIFDRLEMPIKSKVTDFKITEDAVLPIGTTLTAAHYIAGQYIDVQGTTIGKGFQGVMKRWGFKGGNASHGASKSHRSAGSIGACQDPGKVWKGKKMAGHMGCKQVVVHNVWVYKVDAERNLLYVRGQVPGYKGNYLKLRDAMFKKKRLDLPFPTYTGQLPEIAVAVPDKDPYHLYKKGKM